MQAASRSPARDFPIFRFVWIDMFCVAGWNFDFTGEKIYRKQIHLYSFSAFFYTQFYTASEDVLSYGARCTVAAAVGTADMVLRREISYDSKKVCGMGRHGLLMCIHTFLFCADGRTHNDGKSYGCMDRK